MSKYNTETLLRKKKIRRYWRITLTLSFLIVLLYGVSFWSANESIKISEVNVSGNKFVSTEKIKQIFDESTSGKYFFIASKRNFLLMPRSAMIRKIENELPVKSVTIHIDDLIVANIEVVEHDPWGLWCDDSVTEESSDNMSDECYFVNDNGLAFIVAPELVIDNLVVLENTEQAALGSFYAKESVFKKFIVVTELLKKINIAIRIISTEDMETFSLTTKSGPVLLMDKLDDPVEVVNNLKTTLEQESINEIQFKNLEYIDLRFEGKAYYKIK